MTIAIDRFRDVTLRDGLQLTGKLLDTEVKVRLIRRLFALGLTELEIGSMARPDLLPSMANTLDVVAQLTPRSSSTPGSGWPPRVRLSAGRRQG